MSKEISANEANFLNQGCERLANYQNSLKEYMGEFKEATTLIHENMLNRTIVAKSEILYKNTNQKTSEVFENVNEVKRIIRDYVRANKGK